MTKVELDLKVHILTFIDSQYRNLLPGFLIIPNWMIRWNPEQLKIRDFSGVFDIGSFGERVTILGRSLNSEESGVILSDSCYNPGFC